MNDKDFRAPVFISAAVTVLLSAVCLILDYRCALLCAVLGIALTAVFAVYTKKRYNRLKELNNYLSLVCSGNYDLDIDDNTEGELSILKNNLYKVITILKTQNEELIKDKTYLADSLADITHQLKTPLTSITVMTDLLKEESDEEKRGEFLSVTESQLEKMRWLITNLLKLSKLDADAIELKREPISSTEFIADCVKPFLVSLDLKGITVINDIEEFTFYADKSWSLEAVQNIIKNCIEHTDKNGIIEISGRSTNIYDTIIIRDNGCGISSEDLPHIFERFYHGENSSAESVGIGLALAAAIIQKERGTVSAKSQLGKGTEFEIRLYKSIV